MIEHLPSMRATLGLIPSTVVIKDRLNNQRIYSTYIHTSICNLKRLKAFVIQKVEVKVSITYDIILAKQSNLYNTKCCKDRENQESHTLMLKYQLTQPPFWETV